MPSFDIVSKFDTHEVTNAVDQAKKEIAQRYDFKNTRSDIVRQDDETIVITSSDKEHVKAALDVLYGRMVKRGVSLKHLDPQEPQPAGGQTFKQTVKLKQGIEQDAAKKIQSVIKESKLKVQASITGDSLRVTGKQRDDLQQAIAHLRNADVGVEMQFNNFRD